MMQLSTPHLASTGAAMDIAVPRRYGKRIVLAVLVVAGILLIGLAVWQWMPRGLQVAASDVRIASVERGIFVDDIVVRALAAPLNSVILDSVESGRVEEVFARDGAVVQKGELLFRLSNPQRRLDLLARQSDHAQQFSNLSNLRVSVEASRTDHQRRLSDLDFNLAQAEKQHARNVRLAERGFISSVAVEESADKLAQQRRTLAEEKSSSEIEIAIKHNAMTQMEHAIAGLETGLQVVNATLDALSVRAPVTGRLTDFRLQVGETVRPDQHIGRIDDPSHFKLAAQVDEYYLSRVAVGRHGSVKIDEQSYPVEVNRVFPQIKEGRFAVELVFAKIQPSALNPGQSVDAQITLGEPTTALLLPNAAFVNDSGGAWAFVVARDGERVDRRVIKIGRRSNSQIEVLTGLAAGEKVIVSSYTTFGKATRLQLNK